MSHRRRPVRGLGAPVAVEELETPVADNAHRQADGRRLRIPPILAFISSSSIP
jgi:hypothetical protein